MIMLNAKIIFSAPVYTTEDPEKVKGAVSNIVNFGKPKNEEIQPTLISGANPNKDSKIQDEDRINPFVSDAESIKQTVSAEGDLTLLSSIHYLIRREEIIDTANTALINGVSEDGCSLTVLLNKQAAFMKHLSFPADIESLGSVALTIKTETSDELEKIIDWLTPPTKDGIPLYELKMSDL